MMEISTHSTGSRVLQLRLGMLGWLGWTLAISVEQAEVPEGMLHCRNSGSGGCTRDTGVCARPDCVLALK